MNSEQKLLDKWRKLPLKKTARSLRFSRTTLSTKPGH